MRLHRKTTEEFLHYLTDTLRVDPARYQMHNDEVAVPFFMGFGLPADVARNWAVPECLKDAAGIRLGLMRQA